MGDLGKGALAVGAGFIAAQASIAGVQAIMSKSIGAAMAYEAQMAEMRALTGATKEDTDQLTVAIKDMARTMPKSPAELGSAAYFILSSGIEDVTDATKVLEIAAKASSVGLGETETVADALTTVLNAYGLSADHAGSVTDIMMEAVKQGKAEAGEFAGVLGRVVPLAAQMGIGFEEVSANLATFTLLGVSAEEAATGLRAVMASLLKPTEQQKEAMQELGFSADELRQQIRERGLLATLDAMMEATDGNEAAVAKLFPNIRALTSVLGTAGVQMDSYKDILNATNDATGNLDEGFAIVSQTTKFKVDMAMQELNLALMEVGEVTLPLVAEAAGIASDAVIVLSTSVRIAKGDFESLDDSAKDAALNLLGLASDVLSPLSTQINDLTAIVESGAMVYRTAFGSGGTADTALTDLQKSWATTDVAIAEGMALQVELEMAAAGAAAGERDLAGAVAGLASSLAVANQQLQDNLALLGGITGQRTAETLAIDIEINALEQEQNAAERAAIGQQSYGGAVESTTSAIDEQIKALENQAAALIPEAIEAEIIALEHEAAVLQLTAVEIEGQIIAKQNYIDSTQEAADAVQAEIDAQEDLLKSLGSTLKGLDKQIAAEKKLAAERAGTLPHNIKLNKLELEKMLLLQKAGGDTYYLTDAERERLDEIKRMIDAEQRAIRIKELEAEATRLQAQESGEHLKALEAEKAAVEAEMAATEENIRVREEYIDALHPPELLAEIEALKDQKAEFDRQIDVVNNLKGQRELYIKTLVPPELQQEIDALGKEKTALDNAKGAVDGLVGSTNTYADQTIPNAITKLGLEKEAIDLVTRGWELQGEAILGLPTVADISSQLHGLKQYLLIQARLAMLAAIEAGDWQKQKEIAGYVKDLMAWQPAQHGFHGTVTGPRGFFIEPGRTERVDITPGGGGDTAAPPMEVNINVTGATEGEMARQFGLEMRGLLFGLGLSG